MRTRCAAAGARGEAPDPVRGEAVGLERRGGLLTGWGRVAGRACVDGALGPGQDGTTIMKLAHLELQKFTTFRHAEFEFSPGINVFVGENSTGKSHVMKLLYSTLQKFETAGPMNKTAMVEELKQKLAAVFRPNQGRIGRLVQRGVGRDHARVVISRTEGARLELNLTTLGRLDAKATSWVPAPKSIFLPSREVLSMYEGFIGAYSERKLSFDETYFDACVALSSSPLRGPRGEKAAALIAPIVAALGGKVTRDGDVFYVNLGGKKMEAHLVAEGLRKIASLAYLVQNGALIENGILFWDEPEANLNPKLITRVSEFLRSIADYGVQVFIATHDYLLTQKLSLAVEYGKGAASGSKQTSLFPLVDTRFFSFVRCGTGVVVRAADTLAEMVDNPILDEFARHHDYERELFESAIEGKDDDAE